MSLSPLNVEKSRVVKNFCDTELLERERQKERKKKHKKKISSLHPFLSKTNGSLHQFLDGYYHIIISMWTRVNKCLIFNFALLDFSYRF